jgi:hypothetical protein
MQSRRRRVGNVAMADSLTDSLKRATAALEAGRVPYLLGGGMGCWARGGPPSSNDIDLMVKREDAERALETLGRAGMRTEKPPEQWLYKAWDGDVLIDLIFEPSGMRITDEVLERGEDLSVAGMYMHVMNLDDIFVTKLLAIDEHEVDYSRLLPIARSLREQIDWRTLRRRTAESPFARAFFALADGLGISLDERAPEARVRSS